jgi:uncharacterized protein
VFRGILLTMTGAQHIDYEQLAQEALRGIVRRVLMHVARSGLPGQHHFYISFNTSAPGASLSPRLKERYPEEMTIVLQHRFWDLMVNEERFEVKLTFDGVPERLVVPFTAIKVFFDPSVPYGLQFEGSDLAADAAQDLGGADEPPAATAAGSARSPKADTPGQLPAPAKAEKKPRAPRKPRAAKEAADSAKARPGAAATEVADAGKGPRSKPVVRPDQHEPAANDAKIVHLDKFRKK